MSQAGQAQTVLYWYSSSRQAGANVIETVDRIREVLPQLEKWIPPSIKITELSDRTTTIRASVHDVQFSLLLSIALVVMVIFLFLRRLWPTFIASITVPLALAGTFALMYLCNYSIDNLSLMAVTISVGFVVDDAIVVIENIHRFIELGDSPMQAAFKGAKQIGFTVISMSTSLTAVIHSPAVHERLDRAFVSRVCRDGQPGHPGFEHHFTDTYADVVLSVFTSGSLL